MPGRLRIAEPRAGAKPGLQVRPVDKLRAAIKGDRAAGSHGPRQGRARRASAICDMIGLVRFSGFLKTTTNRLNRSTIVVTLAGPNFCGTEPGQPPSDRTRGVLQQHRAGTGCWVRAQTSVMAACGGDNHDACGVLRRGGAKARPPDLSPDRRTGRSSPGLRGASHLRTASSRQSAPGSSQPSGRR